MIAMRITLPTPPTKLYGIIGYPLGHSMSPALHNWGFEALGVAGEYRAFPVEPSGLGEFMAQVRALPVSGLSVTIPHKLAVTGYLDSVSDRAKKVGAVNTLYWDEGRLLGENTDVHGFLEPLRHLDKAPASALILGAGGAARAAIAGLRELGVPEITVTARTLDKAWRLAADFKATAIPWDDRAGTTAELLVNTTPLGMQGDRRHLSPWPDAIPLAPNQIAYDTVYNPQTTRFLSEAQHHGCQTIDGLTMFIHQAARQFHLWTGHHFDTSQARELVAGLLQE